MGRRAGNRRLAGDSVVMASCPAAVNFSNKQRLPVCLAAPSAVELARRRPYQRRRKPRQAPLRR